MKVKDALKDYDPEAFDKLSEWLGKNAADTIPKDLDALQLYVWLKRVQGLADVLMKQLLPEANKQFTKVAGADTTAKAWKSTDFATVAKCKANGTWVYPPHIVECEADLKRSKELMKTNKQAAYTPGSADPERDALFRVHLQKV